MPFRCCGVGAPFPKGKLSFASMISKITVKFDSVLRGAFPCSTRTTVRQPQKNILSLSFLFLYIVWGVSLVATSATKGFASGHHELFEKSSIKNFFASTSEYANMSDRRVMKLKFCTIPKRDTVSSFKLVLIAEHNMTILKMVDDSQ